MKTLIVAKPPTLNLFQNFCPDLVFQTSNLDPLGVHFINKRLMVYGFLRFCQSRPTCRNSCCCEIVKNGRYISFKEDPRQLDVTT
jgi:hypothetical protein